MKKTIVSLLLILLLCFNTTIANAQTFTENKNNPADATDDNTFLFKDKYLAWVKEANSDFDYEYFYFEPYIHQDKNGNIDWALLYAGISARTDEIIYFRAGNVIVYAPGASDYFHYGYGIYDVSSDKFIDLDSLGKSTSKYEGLEEFLGAQEYNRVIGDVNYDNQVNIKDATEIQLQLIQDAPKFDSFAIGQSTTINENSGFFADCNEDGKVNIRDATFIQKKLAA